jgi:hypothetical protein
MVKLSPAKRQIRVRLLHNGAQPGTPLAELLIFGLQDTKGEIQTGNIRSGDEKNFDLILDIKNRDETDQPVFQSSYAHGPATSRFLYLSWKREGGAEHPWGWRIKIPLSGIDWALISAAGEPGKCLFADVTGRRPHASDAIAWQIEEL